MALTKRELSLFLLTVAAIIILLSDRYVISPVWASRQAVSQQKQEIITLVARNKDIVENVAPVARRKWKQMEDDGLYDDPARSENMMINYLNEISRQYGITLSSIQPDYGSQNGGIGILDFTVAGSGFALDVYEFIWSIETSKKPIRLDAVHISSKDSSSGQVSVQLKLSVIYAYQQAQSEVEVE